MIVLVGFKKWIPNKEVGYDHFCEVHEGKSLTSNAVWLLKQPDKWRWAELLKNTTALSGVISHSIWQLDSQFENQAVTIRIPPSLCDDEISSPKFFTWADNPRAVACFLVQRNGDCTISYHTVSTFSSILAVFDGSAQGVSTSQVLCPNISTNSKQRLETTSFWPGLRITRHFHWVSIGFYSRPRTFSLQAHNVWEKRRLPITTATRVVNP